MALHRNTATLCPRSAGPAMQCFERKRKKDRAEGASRSLGMSKLDMVEAFSEVPFY